MDVDAAIDECLRREAAAGRPAGLAIGVRTPAGVVVRGPAGQFEIGSITKVFTGLILARMAARDEVGLDQPVAELLPAGVAVPAPITLGQLAAHLSRLPRLPEGLSREPGWSLDNPYAHVTASWLYDSLARTRVRGRWRRRFHYSNLGMGLLGHALALRRTGADDHGEGYATLVHDEVCGPLGLASTGLDGQPEPAHSGAGRPVPHWDLAVLAGAGGLRSTVEDLLAFLENQLGAGPVSPTWVRRGNAYWHNGGTGGSASFAAAVPERGTAVVALANSARSITRPGIRLLRAVSGAPSP